VYIVFWICFIIIMYSYFGYPLLIYTAHVIIKSFFGKTDARNEKFEPEVTLLIAAYNEIDFLNKKIANSNALNYPKEKLHQIWITDGSDDGTPQALKKYPHIKVYHKPERSGKIGAINRAMRYVKTSIVIFSDANSQLNKEAVKNIVREFSNPKVGCVAGEKRVVTKSKDNAVNFGEGFYWRYESFLKTCESTVNSALGAVGELFAIKTKLFEEIKPDTILDDFTISLKIAQKGYTIKYTPEAYAVENASVNISEELKRKNRIAYGGFQAMSRLKELFNIFKHPMLTFQFISHKVIRWTIVPFSFFFIFLANFYIICFENRIDLYDYLFYTQLIFYIVVIIGAVLQSRKTNFKFIFAPYYLFIMNLSEVIGLIRFIRKKQSVNWERAKREQ